MLDASSSNGHAAPPTSPARRAPARPPHVAWPAFVVLLLLMSIGAAAVTVYLAHSDGGVQIVDDSPYAPKR